jgi:hypothetical protein
MFERHSRRRLDADLLRWQSEGTISAAAGEAIRRSLGPMPGTVGVATMVVPEREGRPLDFAAGTRKHPMP